MITFEFFEVGGTVRDDLLGLPCKDFDFTAVAVDGPLSSMEETFARLEATLREEGFDVFLTTPEFLTVRGRFPEGHIREGEVGDFVLARRDGPSSDGRRPDWVMPGGLVDDLSRRDFTVNAMARTLDGGEIIDLFDGQGDLADRILRFVGDPMQRIQEDALRVMRALRFAVTKGFTMSPETWQAIGEPSVPELLASVSEERREQELSKMCRFDSTATVRMLASLPPEVMDAIFAGRVRLDATLKSS